MRLDDGLPPPPPRRPRCQAVRQLLHRILVATKDPFVDTSVTVHCQVARVTFPHEHRGVALPSLEWGPFGPVGKKLPSPLKDPPYLVGLYPLFPEPTIVERPYTLLQVTRDHKGVDHFIVARPVATPGLVFPKPFFSFSKKDGHVARV